MKYYEEDFEILKSVVKNPGPLYECEGEDFKCLENHPEVAVSQAHANEPNEDQFLVDSNSDIKFYGLFDGHFSATASLIAKYIIYRFIESGINHSKQKEEIDMKRILELSYLSFDRYYTSLLNEDRIKSDSNEKYISGTSALTVTLFNKHLYIANCGDIHCVLIRKEENNKDNNKFPQYISYPINTIHSISNPIEQLKLLQSHNIDEEKDLITKYNDSSELRIKGLISTTRSLGDFYMKCPQSQIPDVYKDVISPSVFDSLITCPYITSMPEVIEYIPQKNDEYLVIYTSTVNEFLKKDDFQNILKENKDGDIKNIANSIIARTRRRVFGDLAAEQYNRLSAGMRKAIHDDMTVMVIDLNKIDN